MKTTMLLETAAISAVSAQVAVLLGRNNPTLCGQVARVTLPGDSTPLPFRGPDKALEVTLPADRHHPIGVALVLSGTEVAA